MNKLISLTSLALLLAACSSADSQGDAATPSAAAAGAGGNDASAGAGGAAGAQSGGAAGQLASCTPGDARTCTTDDGMPGTQSCGAMGEGYGDCVAQGAGGAGPEHFIASELLGRPTASGVTLSLVPAVAIDAFVEVSDTGGAVVATTPTQQGEAGQPLVIELTGLQADTHHAYKVLYRLQGQQAFMAREARAFHTQRKPGSPFVFTIQADSHLDDRSSVDLYHRTLELAAAAAPDFHVDLGDTFMCEKHSAPLTGEVKPASSLEVVMARYLSEREHFGLLAHSTPLFLVSGNHEGESGFLLDGTENNLAVWATLSRKRYYPNPDPNDTYSTSATDEPIVGKRQNPYAFTWGDALFVMIDPFWYTATRAKGTDRWAWTLGKAQYDWLSKTLLESKARHKFVFAHHVVGGKDNASRGGVEVAPYFEWGGKELDGTDTFATHRPGWARPIHALFVEAGVSAFFHGHDHVYVQQELDGVIYQEVPQPSATNFMSGEMLAQEGGYVSGTVRSSSGHIRVTVSADEAKVEYVRSFLPKDEGQGRSNGAIDHSYSIKAR